MTIEVLEHRLTVCRLSDLSEINMTDDIYFIGKTDKELSLVCKTQSTPKNAIAVEDGWRGMRIAGVLDFSLVGILGRIATVLAESGISIFAVSTFDTDYILVKEDKLDSAISTLEKNGHIIIRK